MHLLVTDSVVFLKHVLPFYSNSIHAVDSRLIISYCPLQVGMMLRGMGFDNTTSLFVAAGKIYKVEKHMAPLKQMFPGLETKDTLASPEELAPFVVYS